MKDTLPTPIAVFSVIVAEYRAARRSGGPGPLQPPCGGAPGRCRPWRGWCRSSGSSLPAGAGSHGNGGASKAGGASKGQGLADHLVPGFGRLTLSVLPADLQEHPCGVPDHLAGLVEGLSLTHRTGDLRHRHHPPAAIIRVLVNCRKLSGGLEAGRGWL